MTSMKMNRRDFGSRVVRTLSAGTLGVGSAGAAMASRSLFAASEAEFSLKYIVASCMYGKKSLAEIIPEVPKCGAGSLEIWAEPHGNQREQIDELGEDRVRELLDEHDVQIGSFTCFKYGIFNMQDEVRLVKRLGGDMVICNTGGPKELTGAELKAAIDRFAEKLKPHVDLAEELGVTIGIENHGGGLISSPESQLRVVEALPSERLGIAMAPYHLPQDPELLGGLIRKLDKRLVHFQAWEHGLGCMKKLPKEQELQQLPHRGPLDWTPILAALRDINYQGRTEIFMHPVPRGIPILPTTADITAEINKARSYLAECLTRSS